MPKRLAFLCIFQLVLTVGAFAQEAPVTDCDKYAASDLDPQRKALGIPFDSMNANLAVPACEDAVRKFPDNARLIFQLGRAYQSFGNFPAALEQFRKAAEKNYVLAQYNLGYMYENARGVTNDDQQAAAWFRKAGDQGFAPAQYNIALMYETGRGVPRDDQQAVTWLRKAADQDYAKAEFELGLLYANGHGVPKDDEQAAAWLRKAATQGLAAAQVSLGVMYGRGQGIPKDVEQALYWLRKASQQGDKKAKLLLAELEALQKNANGNH